MLYLHSWIVLFTKAGLESVMKLLEFCISDNIRNKTIFKTKIAKIAQKLPKCDILKKKMTLTLHNENVLANATKNSTILQHQ